MVIAVIILQLFQNLSHNQSQAHKTFIVKTRTIIIKINANSQQNSIL
jgi:hypothetical protein